MAAKKLCIPAVNIVPHYVINREMFRKEDNLFLECVLLKSDLGLMGKTITERKLEIFENILKKKYHLSKLDIFDLFCGEEKLNICFGTKHTHLFKKCLPDSYKFVGFSKNKYYYESLRTCYFPEDIDVYVSFGTIFNNNLEHYKKFVNVFGQLEYKFVMTIGERGSKEELGDIPENVEVYPVLPQIDILKSAKIFLTHGGE